VSAFGELRKPLWVILDENISIILPGGDTDHLKALARELIALAPNVIYAGQPSAWDDFKRKPYRPTHQSHRSEPEPSRAAGRGRGARAQRDANIGEAEIPDQLAGAFDRLAKAQAQAVIVPRNAMFGNQRRVIVQLSLASRLPSIFSDREFVQVGGLASYGVDEVQNDRRAAFFVDKVLKGARPGDLPIEFPTKFELAFNLKTAKALGLTVPPTLLALADEVIE
jgi:putative ABC transport system substrate-binding protein